MEKKRCEKHGREKEALSITFGRGDSELVICPACVAGLPGRSDRKEQPSAQDQLEIWRQEIMSDY